MEVAQHMNDPLRLHSRLTELLQKIEAQNEPDATGVAAALIAELDAPNAAAQTATAGAAPIRFSGLHHAVAREIRTGERAIAAGNWAAAAKAIRVAISILPY